MRRCFERLDGETQGVAPGLRRRGQRGPSAGFRPSPGDRAARPGDDCGRSPARGSRGRRSGIFWAIHLLFGTFPYKLFNAHVADTVGPRRAAADQRRGTRRPEGVEQSGSNAWVIGGQRTASGAPLLAGDPHRTIELPGCYQQVGLACPEFDVVGFTFPGVPGVQHFAHAGSVAWGITNAMADYQDLTIESLRLAPGAEADAAGGRPLEARGVDGWEPVTSLGRDGRRARGSAGRRARRRHRPRARSSPGSRGRSQRPSRRTTGQQTTAARPAAYSLRTPTPGRGTTSASAPSCRCCASRTVDDVEQALARWVEPVNSALVADTLGRMRHLVVGRVARARRRSNLVRPLAAWDPRHVWRGYRRACRPATSTTSWSARTTARAAAGWAWSMQLPSGPVAFAPSSAIGRI